MEYFVDEMPRDCASCKHYHMNCADGYSCSKLRKEIHPNFSEGIGYRHQDCPLQSIADYTKQVREEVVEEIKAELNKQKLVMKSDFSPREEEAIPWQDIVAILDQVKGESNVLF